MKTSRALALSSLLGGLLAGCPFASLPDGGIYRCGADSSCPDGLSCQEGYCVSTSSGGGSGGGTAGGTAGGTSGGVGGGDAGGAGGGLGGGAGGPGGGTSGGSGGGLGGGEPDGGVDGGCSVMPACQPQECGSKTNACGTVACPGTCTMFQRCGLPWLPNRCAPIEVCNRDGYCWENPLPQGNSLQAVAQVGTEKWAVGELGTIVKSLNNGFIEVEDPVIAKDGLNGIWSASATDVWVVGDNATVLHFDGALWTKESPGLCASNYTAVWSAGQGVVYVGTSLTTNPGCLLERSAAGTWTKKDLPRAGRVNSVWGSNGKVFATSRDTVWERSAATSAWTEAVRTDGGVLNTVFGVADHFWAAGNGGQFAYTTDAGVWRFDSTQTGDVQAVFGQGPDDLWAVGSQGLVRWFNGLNWVQVQAPDAGLLEWRGGVSSASASGLSVGARGSMARLDGLSAVATSLNPTGVRLNLTSVARLGPTQVVAGAEGGVVTRVTNVSNTRWVYSRPTGLPSGTICHSVAGTTRSAVAACSDGYVARFTDAGWRAELATDAGNSLFGVTMPADDVAWVVGAGGTVLLSQGDGGWARQVLGSYPGRSFYGVTSADVDRVWAVGTGGANLQLKADASVQTQELFGLPFDDYTAAAALSTPTAARWFVGHDSAALAPLAVRAAQNGPYLQSPLPPSEDLVLWGVEAAADNAVWAVGDFGAVFHLTDAGWSLERAPTTLTLTGVLSLPDGGQLLVGDDGTVLRRR